MNKQEYAEKATEIIKQISELNKQYSELELSYLNQQDLRGGDKVIVEIESHNGISKHYAFIKKIGVHSTGEYYYRFWKSKKDGTPSCNILHYSGKVASITKAENNHITPTSVNQRLSND